MNAQLFVETQDLTKDNEDVNNHIWHSFFDIIHNKWSKFVQLVNKKDLDTFRDDIMKQICQLSFDASWPVGSVYVQYPGCKKPSEIFANVKTADGKTIPISSKWIDISSPNGEDGKTNNNRTLDPGSFFRTEGSPANAFLGPGSATLGQSQACGAPNIWGNLPADDFMDQGWEGAFFTWQKNGPWDYSSGGHDGRWIGWRCRFEASRCSNVYQNNLTELRPKNYSIKIWRRNS